jgi:predicted Ser/Thr protein kinase
MDDFIGDMDSPARNLLSGLKKKGILSVHQLACGRNNKAFILEYDGVPTYVMKRYFQHMSDPRDRCRAEWAFLQYAQSRNISCVPTSIACDPGHGIAIMEYIAGLKIPAGGIRKDHVRQALDFFLALNKDTAPADWLKLPPASESCFSLRDHVNCVDRRIDNLSQIGTESEIDLAAGRFVRSELIPQWHTIRSGIKKQIRLETINPEERLTDKDICISPSDFGFHNAILTSSGRVFFIDFEYAGRDDPVKMICDFFCQPDVPIPRTYLPDFANCVLDRFDNPETHKKRLEIVLPVHTIKWCCILLNEFLPLGRARREFAGSLESNLIERKITQLDKARQMLALCQ